MSITLVADINERQGQETVNSVTKIISIMTKDFDKFSYQLNLEASTQKFFQTSFNFLK